MTALSPAIRKDLGDYQTPPELVAMVLDTLGAVGGRFSRVLEPTCGRGHFIAGLLGRPDPPREIRGFEIQPDHAEVARTLGGPGVRSVIRTADLFGLDLRRDLTWDDSGPMLVVGNLPWVTAAAIGSSGGSNGPARSNVRGLRGLDAMTGNANFDISEALWLKLIRELAPERPVIAMLCKSAVARAVLRAIRLDDLPVTAATLWRIDAPRWFRATVDASLLRVEVGPGPKAVEVAVHRDLSCSEPESLLGLEGEGGRLIADLDAHRRADFADGVCPLTWRQGVKHDAAGVMELTLGTDGRTCNKLGEAVEVEEEYVYPLLKGTDLAGSRRPRPRLSVVVTQRGLGEDTRTLEHRAPRLWTYLQAHADAFERRKSSIYRGRPPFAMFGVGDYSFAPFKVAISGLHKTPRFRAIGPVDGRPTLVDDTCYFLPCRDLEQATTLTQVLNGPEALDLLRALVFPDAKRPITKTVLQRVDLKALMERSGEYGPWRENWEHAWPGHRSSREARV